ncbi:MAG: UvrD-helicase domain-containing protein [bacterium]
MKNSDKEVVINKTKKHIKDVVFELEKVAIENQKALKKSKKIYKTLSWGDKIVEDGLIKYGKKRVGELQYLKGSPYFVRCDVIWENEKEIKSIFFGKFGFGEKEIYSWITPASTIRYENPGQVRYIRPDGNLQKASLVRKDQYMIVGGEIKFLATEDIDNPRELVYQEYFSSRKTGFVLPEIVAQMEKAQDQVIRAHHIGPFLISGPAGSGKTTLALHRTAYLVQAPDLSSPYTNDSIVVFVQDNGTKEYFSHLLPELGIEDVLITTFSDWAFSILDIDSTYVFRFGQNESEKDLYEFVKLKALNGAKISGYRKNNIYNILENYYGKYFSQSQKELFQEQKKLRLLDRIDLSLLLDAYANANGGIGTIKDYWIELKNGSMRKKRGFVPFEYSLAVVDEFQNYLPLQLSLIKSCISKKSQSILYIGDMAQQVQLGTISDWGAIGEKIEDQREVILHKVYRNTENILRYIESLGYKIEIPEGIKKGCDVVECIFHSINDEILHIGSYISSNDFASIGILAKNEQYLHDFKKAFDGNKSVHVMTMYESQGVEFDIVFIVGISADTFSLSVEIPVELVIQKAKINSDLLYVALTRAISQLQVLGKVKLVDIMQN